MARLGQQYLPLDWQAVEEAPDLDRLRLVLEDLPDEGLMRRLESRRWGRPDGASVRVKWNCLLAQRVLGHRRTSELLRELRRNPTLRRLVGIPPGRGVRGVPDKDQMSRFWQKLVKRHAAAVEALLVAAQAKLAEHLPDLGAQAGVDSTALRTWARGRGDPAQSADPEADWGRKTRRWTDKEGRAHEEVTKWFGYKGHFLVDTRYELPLAWEVTRASRPDNEPVLDLVGKFHRWHAGKRRVQTLSGDKAYDDGDLVKPLWGEEKVRAVFDLRDSAQDGEDGERLAPGENILLGDDGQVYCYAGSGSHLVRQAMVPWGFEAKRGTQKYRCPAAVAGISCPERERCGRGRYGRVVRVKNHQDWRRFGPLARGTKQWERLYRARTANERVNSRVKEGMGLDDPSVRGRANMQMAVNLAVLALYGLALGHLRRKAKAWRSYTRLAQ